MNVDRVLACCLLLLIGCLVVTPAAAQGPSADWQTLVTEHFRLHYPAAAAAWSERVASRLEAIRRRVGDEVGYLPPETVEILVMDPIARANGSAWSILGSPRLVLWTTPPPPDSVIGHYRDWGELLVTHEVAHLAHLLRPSRNRGERLVSALVPVGPIPRRAPRWVIEGYATLIEGRLTGYGRPHSDLRATILRRWAQLGELPEYGALAADSQGWLGMSMACLIGSAYLEWLVERSHPEALRQLWARLTATRQRTFDDAFVGVFGDSPHKLYNRFRAELTYRAMALEERLAPRVREGEVWQDLSWTTGVPALSPDGERLAIVLRRRDRPSRLVIWSTVADDEAESAWQEVRAELVLRDPQDVPAIRVRPLVRTPLHELPTRHGAEPHGPRFTADGRALLYTRFEPDSEGFRHPDLFRWTPATDRVERLTWGADVREVDPSPNGRAAVAVRHRHGLSQLVWIDLASGAITELTPASVDTVYAQPRIDPQGRRLVFVRQSAEGWRLVVRRLADGVEVELSTPPRATLAHPSWSPAGDAVYATVGGGGFLDLWRLAIDHDLTTAAATRLTLSHGAALAGEPDPSGQAIFYLGLEADGLDLRRLELAAATPVDTSTVVARDDWPAVPPALPAVPEIERAPLAAAESYGLGRQEWLPLIAGGYAPGGEFGELGARFGDLVGRLDGVAVASFGRRGPRGGAVSVAWRGWPVELFGHLFTAEEQLSRQPEEVPGLGTRLDLERRGLEILGRRALRLRRLQLEVAAGVTLGEVEPASAPSLNQEIAFLRLAGSWHQGYGAWRLRQEIATELDLGRTGGASWNRQGGDIGLAVSHREMGELRLRWTRHAARGVTQPFDRYQLGGLRPSILPDAIAAARLSVPALPAATLLGDEHEGQKISLTPSGWPLALFYERHRLWPAGAARGEWLALRGLELHLRQRPMPLLRLPGLDLRLGLAEILDPPFEGQIEGWISLAWHP